jgi:hypothetical protein
LAPAFLRAHRDDGDPPAGRRTRFFVFFVSLVYTARMRALFKKADEQKETKETKALHLYIAVRQPDGSRPVTA